MPTYFCFQPEDSEIEVSHLKDAKLVVIDSVWGHMGKHDHDRRSYHLICHTTAGGGANAVDTQFLAATIREFLSD
jgi:hypothetical protein